jgi:cell division protein FtsA
MSSVIAVGLDIGTHTTRVVVSEVRDNHPPQILALGKSLTAGLHHGYVINRYEAVKSIQSAVRSAEKSYGKRISRVYVSIGGISLASDTVTTSLQLGPEPRDIRATDLERIHRSCEKILLGRSVNVRIVHSVPVKYQVDGALVHGNPIGLIGTKLSCKMSIITALEHHFEDLLSVVNEAGLDILDIVASPVATGLVALEQRQSVAGCALLDIGAETSSLAVYEDGVPISLCVFNLGASDITNDIALGFRIPLDQAEHIKIGKPEHTGTFSKSKIEDIIEARLGDIFELVEKHLCDIGRQGLLPAGIIMTGGGSALLHLEDFAKAALKLPAKVHRPEAMTYLRKKLPDASWLVAYGLCAVASEQQNPLFRQERIMKNMLKVTKERIIAWLTELLP